MYSLLRPLLFQLDPEKAHELTFKALGWGAGALLPLTGNQHDGGSPLGGVQKQGLSFKNKVGLAAGMDKNARLVHVWPRLGFGHVEVGTVTPKPQEGNSKPRLFRLPADEALINRMGFNNDGAEAIRKRLEKLRPPTSELVIGGNIGKNKDTPDAEAFKDYLLCMEALHEVVDYFTVNISSPNTEGLRGLQDREPLWKLLGELQNRNQRFGKPKPILVKIAPDLTELQLADISLVVQETQMAGIVATNTTTSREGLATPGDQVRQMGAGGLSGRPLAGRGRYFTGLLRKMLPADFLLLSSGGIVDGAEAKARFESGADLVQLYTGFVYKGPGLVGEVLRQVT